MRKTLVLASALLVLTLASVAAGKHKHNATSFSYAPASAVVWWVDANGNHGGAPGDDLEYFNANADFDSVSVLDLDPADLGTDTPITSVSNLADLPNLAVLDVANNPSLNTLNLSGCELLERVLASNCSLNVKQVNTVLHDLAALTWQPRPNGISHGWLYIDGQTPPAPPSHGPPNGIAAEHKLVNEDPPWTVVTD